MYSLNTFSSLLILLRKDKFLMAVWTRQTMVEVFTIACVWWMARRCYNWQKWFTAYADMGRKCFRREQRDPFNHRWKRNLKLDSVLPVEVWWGAKEGRVFQHRGAAKCCSEAGINSPHYKGKNKSIWQRVCFLLFLSLPCWVTLYSKIG